MFSSLMPKTVPFFDMLEEQNSILRNEAATFLKLLEDYSQRNAAHKEIVLLEEKGDAQHALIVRELSLAFITPIDREDILRINQAQEICTDTLQRLATRVEILAFPRIRFPMLRAVRTVIAMLDLTQTMLIGLKTRTDSHTTHSFHDLRDEAAMVLESGMGELLDANQALDNATLLQMLKWSQIYERMELLVEQVNELAEAIEEAVMKNV